MVLPAQLERHRFSAAEYQRMVEVGILSEDDRVELIEGEIVAMSPMGSRHAACVDRLNAAFAARLGQEAIVRVQSPVRLDDFSEPEPDLALLRPRADFYAEAHPTPADILLVVEVMEASREYDRKVKVPLYARAGIQEVWLVDAVEGQVHVLREPAGDAYGAVGIHGRRETLAPLAFPDLALGLSQILP